jgi:hypothetical protein
MPRFILNIFLVSVLLLWSQFASAHEKKVKIIEPSSNAEVESPFKICLKSKNLIVEPAKKGNSEGKGHHHLLFSSLPTDLTKPLGKKISFTWVTGLRAVSSSFQSAYIPFERFLLMETISHTNLTSPM